MKAKDKFIATLPNWDTYTWIVKSEWIHEWKEYYILEILSWEKKWDFSFIFKDEIDNTIKLDENN